MTTTTPKATAGCEKCGSNKVCVSYQCCPHSLNWFYMRGISSATCRICGGSVTNPEWEEGQETWAERVKRLEAENSTLKETNKILYSVISHLEANED